MRKILIIGMAILMMACSSNVPKGILPEKELIPVLVEIHLAESVFIQRYAMQVTRTNYLEDLYLSILKRHHLDQKKFEESILFYGKHPEIYKPIYDEVLNRLNEMHALAQAKDSIRTHSAPAQTHSAPVQTQ